jgi:hypothetical protein
VSWFGGIVWFVSVHEDERANVSRILAADRVLATERHRASNAREFDQRQARLVDAIASYCATAEANVASRRLPADFREAYTNYVRAWRKHGKAVKQTLDSDDPKRFDACSHTIRWVYQAEDEMEKVAAKYQGSVR